MSDGKIMELREEIERLRARNAELEAILRDILAEIPDQLDDMRSIRKARAALAKAEEQK